MRPPTSQLPSSFVTRRVVFCAAPQWSEREAANFATAIKDHNIVGIVHGHTHACVFYRWKPANTGRSYDVYNAPALQKGGPKDPLATPSQYLVFELDRAAGRFRAFQRVGSSWGSISHEKNLTATAPPAAQPAAAAAAAALQPAGVEVIAADPVAART